jgi:eukaryotic-like serine/threonine-protein kinase
MSGTGVFDRIAGFAFVRLLGSGTFANTYLAERRGERFAVKVFHDLPAAGKPRERFRREVNSLRIEHPNLARYVESGVAQCGGRQAAYIAMRYVPGQSLADRLATGVGGLPVAQAVDVAQGICRGLEALHEHDTVHRDLKPANIYLPAAGGVVILDFGLARVRDLTTITARGAFVGTLAYCAPEQIRGEADIHSDIYALGAVLFEMLTGHRPFTATNELELIERITREEPEPAGALAPGVPDWLERLVAELLAKEPLQRPRSARAALATLSAPAARPAPAVRAPYERSSPPLLALRAQGPGSARAPL